MIAISRRRAKTVKRIVFAMMIAAVSTKSAIMPRPTRPTTSAARSSFVTVSAAKSTLATPGIFAIVAATAGTSSALRS